MHTSRSTRLAFSESNNTSAIRLRATWGDTKQGRGGKGWGLWGEQHVYGTRQQDGKNLNGRSGATANFTHDTF